MASTVNMSIVADRRGAPIAQRFLKDDSVNVSLVATPAGVSCVASQVLPIMESSYLDPDGRDVPFAEITRSKASSLQSIARPGEDASFRLQLKYTPDPEAPITLTIADQSLDLSAALEPSRDSLWLTGALARAFEDALRTGLPLTVQARSAGTGRLVTDRIDAPDMNGFDGCLVTLEDLLAEDAISESAADTPADAQPVEAQFIEALSAASSLPDDAGEGSFDAEQAPPLVAAYVTSEDESAISSALPVPRAGLRVELEARPDPEMRVTQSALDHCRMRDIPDALYLGRLNAVSGFFAQTQDVYVSFAEDGRIERAYIPGIFDADLRQGANTAYLSLAADSNVPDQPNTVRGCLGDALFEAPICVISAPEDDEIVLGECGVLGASDMREDPLDERLISDFATPESFAASPFIASTLTQNTPTGEGFRTASSFRGFGGGGSTGGSGGGFGGGSSSGGSSSGGSGGGSSSGGSGGGSGDGGEGNPPVPSVPLPAAVWLLLTGLGALKFLHHKRIRRRSFQAP